MPVSKKPTIVNVPTPAPAVSPIAPIAPILPRPTPTSGSKIVLAEDYYISFDAPQATREPSTTEYAEMLFRINQWFETQFASFYANSPKVQFIRAETSNDFTLYGVNHNIPPQPANFNIYINYDFTAFTFSASSNIPTTQEVFEVMRLSFTQRFLLEVVRTFTGYPFESTVEVFLAASQFTTPVAVSSAVATIPTPNNQLVTRRALPLALPQRKKQSSASEYKGLLYSICCSTCDGTDRNLICAACQCDPPVFLQTPSRKCLRMTQL